MKPLYTILLLTLLFLAPQYLSATTTRVKGKGVVRSEFRKITPFTRIDSHISADIHIVKSNIRNVQLKAQENILPLIKVTERDGILQISSATPLYYTDSAVTIYIYIPAIDEITLSGEGIISSDLPVKKISLSGTGKIYCRGRVRQATVSITGNGEINLIESKINSADIFISGNGTVHVTVSDKLQVSIPGKGTVFVAGKPEIVRSISSDSELISLN